MKRGWEARRAPIVKILLFTGALFTQVAVAGQITVAGRVDWTDGSGGRHPARLTTIEFWDVETVGGPRLASRPAKA